MERLISRSQFHNGDELMSKKNKQRTMQLWEIPLTGSYRFELEKGDHTKEDIDSMFWCEYSGHVHLPDAIDSNVEEIKVVEEWEEDDTTWGVQE